MNPSLWKNRSFALLFAAQLVSLLGSSATTNGLALFAYRMAGGSAAFGSRCVVFFTKP